VFTNLLLAVEINRARTTAVRNCVAFITTTLSDPYVLCDSYVLERLGFSDFIRQARICRGRVLKASGAKGMARTRRLQDQYA
jgi:hypothetical protein